MEKLPPIEKIYEAWTAIADDRVTLSNAGDTATVKSSDNSKTYTINYNPTTDTYSSNDNSTYWRGYAGYPVIAMMMLQGRLPLNPDEANLWAGINWTQLNKKYKNDYAAAVESIANERGINLDASRQLAAQTLAVLATLPASTARLRLPR